MSEEVKNDEKDSKQKWLWLLLLLLLIVFVVFGVVLFLKDNGTAEATDNISEEIGLEQEKSSEETKETIGISSNEKRTVLAADKTVLATATTSVESPEATTNADTTKVPTTVNISDNEFFNEPVALEINGVDYTAKIIDSNGNESDYEENVTLSEEGKYTLTITESDGTQRSIVFTIDTTNPKITGVEDGKTYATEVEPVVEEPNLEKATLTKDGNEVEYELGDSIKEEGTYVITAEDKAGNKTSITFSIDTTAPDLTVTKNITSITNKSVIVTIESNEPVELPDFDWEYCDETKTTIKKVYDNNIEEDVYVKDLYGNKSVANIKITNIDKDAPEITVTTSNNNGGKPTNQDVVATLTSNEPIKDVEGWTKVDEKTFTKVYSNNKKETFEVEDLVGNKTTVKFEVKRIDKIPPILTVVDPENYNIEVYTEYLDKGYSAYDVVDKDVTKLVSKKYQFQEKGATEWSVADKVDTTKLGVYKIIYTAKDKAGNEVEGIRTVTVVDTTAPRLTLNGEAKIKIEAGIDTYTELGATVTDNYDATITDLQPKFINYSINGVYQGKVDSIDNKKLGTYKVVYEYEDTSGNKGLDASRDDHAYVMRIVDVVDTTKPVITLNGESVIDHLEKGIDTYTELGAISTDNYEETKTLEKPSYINLYVLNNEGNYAFKGRVSEVDTNVVGRYNLVYTDVDSNGNEAKKVTRMVFVKDTIAPTATIEYSITEVTNKNITVTLTANENVMISNAGTWNPDSVFGTTFKKAYSQNTTQLVTITDESGNTNTVEVKIKNIDKTAPEAVKIEYSTTELTNGDVIVTITASEPLYGHLGWSKAGRAYKIAKTFTENATEDVILKDKAGNETIVTIKVANIDKTAPVLTVKDISVGNDPVYSQISFKLSDDNLIDKINVNGTEIDMTDNKWGDANYDLLKGYLVEGKNTVTLYDVAGNQTSKTFTIDWTAPTVVDIEYSTTELTNGNVVVTITTSEPIYGHAGWSKAGRAYKITKTFTKNAEETVIVTDKAGNKLEIPVKVSNIDKTGPTLTVKNESIGTDPYYSKIDFKLFDNNMIDKIDVNGTVVDLSNSKWGDANYDLLKGLLVEGENTVTLYDVVGNKTSKTFIMDWTAPTITVEGFIRDMTFDEFGNWDATGGEKLTASEDVVIVNEDALTSVNGSSKEYEIAYSLRNSTPISYRYTLVTVRDRAGNETTMIDTDGDGGIYIPIYAAPSTTSFRLVKPSAQPTTISEEKQESTEDIIKQEESIVSEPVVEEKEPVIEEPVIEGELLLPETKIKEEIIVEEPIIKEEPIVSEPVVEEKEPVIEEIPDVTTEPIVEEPEVITE